MSDPGQLAEAWQRLADERGIALHDRDHVLELCREKVEQLRDLLRRLEWVGGDRDSGWETCPVCFNYKSSGSHDPGCELAAALAGNDEGAPSRS